MTDTREARSVVEVPLTQGKVALISECDADRILKYRWCVRGRVHGTYTTWYAYRNSRAADGAPKRLIAMHREILRAPKGLVVDHIDDDGLNNTRENLRLCTNQQNVANRRYQKGKSGYRGVQIDTRSPNRKPFGAIICVHGRTIALGTFYTAEEAARAYDTAAIKYFGEFARTNFLETGQ